MDSQEAKSILQVYRPGGQDADDPRFAAALQQVKRDPELAKWFAEQTSFDAAMASGVRDFEVPPDLKASILTREKVAELSSRQQWRMPLAVAALVVVLICVGALWWKRGTNDFANYRKDIVESSWNSSKHLDFASSDLKQIQQWLSQQQATADFTLPAGLMDLHIWGCRVLDWHGQRVSFVCFLDGIKHLHLFVIDAKAVRDLPSPNSPDFQKCAGWKTVSWTQGDKVYVLSGMNYLTFVKKCRKAGHWLMTG